MELSQVRAIVTGAARGLGRHFALRLAQAGARVLATDVNVAGLRRLAGESQGLPGELLAAPLDVTAEDEVDRFFAVEVPRLGGLNVLINNAGILRDGLLVSRSERGEILKLPTPQWSRVLETNLTGAFRMAREAAARMIQDGLERGVIVMISSLARSGNPGQSNYAASKAGLDACTRTWALELATHGIRVGGIAPGVIDTPILEGISPQALSALLDGIPLGRMGQPDEVWMAVRFIIECEFFTGRTIEVDGGASLG